MVWFLLVRLFITFSMLILSGLGMLDFLKALIWPAVLVYNVLEYLKI